MKVARFVICIVALPLLLAASFSAPKKHARWERGSYILLMCLSFLSLSLSLSQITNKQCLLGDKMFPNLPHRLLHALLERWIRVVVSELASEIWWGADTRPIAWDARRGRAASVPCRLQSALPRSAANRGAQRPPCPCPAAQGPSERGRPLLPSLALPAVRSDGVFGKRLEKI